VAAASTRGSVTPVMESFACAAISNPCSMRSADMSPSNLIAPIALLLWLCVAMQWLLTAGRMSPRRLEALGAVNIVYALGLAALVACVVTVLHAGSAAIGWLLGIKLAALVLFVLTSVPTARAFLQWFLQQRDVPGLMPRPWQLRRLRRWLLLRTALYALVPLMGLLLTRSGA
jgi:uncharacterized membrane protein